MYIAFSMRGIKMKYKYFTEKERYQLEAFLKVKTPVLRIAKELDKCPATIYNEMKRGTVELMDTHLQRYEVYCADFAQARYDKVKLNKGSRPKVNDCPELISFAEYCIKKKRYSPYATSIMMKRCSGLDITICERTIYNYIHKGILKNITKADMPYRKRKQVHKNIIRIPLKNPTKPLITDRDKSVYKRNVYGHWEMDTVYTSKSSRDNACLLVLTERKNLEEIIMKMPDRKAESVVKCLNTLEKYYGKKSFRETFKTITCDNGVEFSDYEGITIDGRTMLFYCHPYRSCERGSNENQNKLIRRWIKKGDDISKYSDKEIKAIEEWINNYPRKLFRGDSANDLKAFM